MIFGKRDKKASAEAPRGRDGCVAATRLLGGSFSFVETTVRSFEECLMQ